MVSYHESRAWRGEQRAIHAMESYIPHYCWFASDVTAAMLGVNNKSVSFHRQMNSILMQILPTNSFVLTTNMAALSRGCKPRIMEPVPLTLSLPWCQPDRLD